MPHHGPAVGNVRRKPLHGGVRVEDRLRTKELSLVVEDKGRHISESSEPHVGKALHLTTARRPQRPQANAKLLGDPQHG